MSTLPVILISSCLFGIFFYMLGAISSNARQNEADCRPECAEEDGKRTAKNGWAAIMLLLGILCFLSCLCAAILKCHRIGIGFLVAGAVLMLVGGLTLRLKHGFWWW